MKNVIGVSGYGRKDPGDPSGHQVDPEWVAWAEEQTIKLLRAQERFTYLPPGGDIEEAVAEPQPPAPPPAENLDRDPIRVVHEIRLDDPSERSVRSGSKGTDRVVDLDDGRRLVLRVHRDNL